ncbi:MAG: bifunctional 5,10-methylenetetrahydrofolate dehydrogenase/5,10-methenyltetrahydrofolate cyclohydrolase, partial [Patescibacteria group bacterium]
MAIIVKGEKIASQILQKTTQKIKVLRKKGIIPCLGVILVGQNKISEIYINKKRTVCDQVGVKFILKKYSSKISTSKLIQKIREFQEKEKLSGLIVQLPLPKKIDSNKVLNTIKPELDVDYLTERNLGKLISRNYQIEPPTAGAILEILRYYKIGLKGKKVVLIGAGFLVGRPLSNLLLYKGATLMVCNKETKNLNEIIKQADILITGVGKRNLVRGSMLKKGIIIVDAGISFYR